MTIQYVANDGKVFFNEFDCEDYEQKMQHPYLNTITIFDEDNNIIPTLEIFKEETYCCAERIIVPSEEAAADLRWLGCHYGFCRYKDITEAGIWSYTFIDNDKIHDYRFVRTDLKE